MAQTAGVKKTRATGKSATAKKTAVKKVKAKKAGASRITVRKKTVKRATTVKRTSAVKATDSGKTFVGRKAPDLIRAATGSQNLSLKDFLGKTVVLYFYPKDNTPGCTLEGHDFRRLTPEFEKAGAVILGVSKDSVKSHENFKSQCQFPFELLADEDQALCKAFDVIKPKNLYGRHYLGIERSTFVIDREGFIAHEWRKVKVDGHAAEVLEYIKTL